MLRHIKKQGVAVGSRGYHYIVPNFNKIMAREKAVGVYTSQEYQDLYEGRDGQQSWIDFKAQTDEFSHVNTGKGMQGESSMYRKKHKKESFFAWLNTLKPRDSKIPGSQLSSCIRSKYFGLMPFFIESKIEWQKHYVIRLELFPEGKTLRFICLGANGDYEILSKIEEIIPITQQDYGRVHLQVVSNQPFFLDLEMAYAHHGTKEVFIFDKFGKWLKEGTEHEALSLESTYDERKWMDGFDALTYSE